MIFLLVPVFDFRNGSELKAFPSDFDLSSEKKEKLGSFLVLWSIPFSLDPFLPP